MYTRPAQSSSGRYSTSCSASPSWYIVVEEDFAPDPETTPAPSGPDEDAPAAGETVAWLTPTVPRTGDEAPLGRCLLLMAASAAAVLLLTARRQNPPKE